MRGQVGKASEGMTSEWGRFCPFDLNISAWAKATVKVPFTLHSPRKPRPVPATQQALPGVTSQDPVGLWQIKGDTKMSAMCSTEGYPRTPVLSPRTRVSQKFPFMVSV